MGIVKPLFGLAFIVGVFQITQGSQECKARGWETNALLPQDVIPSEYELLLQPNIEAGTFTGMEKIKIKVNSSRDYIPIHAKGLTITDTQILDKEGEPINITETFCYPKNEFWVIRSQIEPGDYTLVLEFKGFLVGKIVGFYRSRYVTKNKETRYLATTKFEPTYARQAFPCFDEPKFKAKFSVKIVRPTERFVALSNMNQIAEEHDQPSMGFTTVTFATTPKMSSYLACFIVCDYDHFPKGTTNNNVDVTVYSRPEQVKFMEYSRDLTVQGIEFFNSYFGFDYPLPKLDLIAVPDFMSGAMENWGMVTYRETSVLIEKGVSSYSDYWMVSRTVCHEIAHQWFGDTVTMVWWDDIWLNEGFASFMAAKCAETLHSERKFLMMEILKSMNPVMIEDSIATTHPIIRDASHPDQITEAFDVISYSKGSSVLKMLEDIAPEKFQNGLKDYISSYKYQNAKTEDLWRVLESKMGDIFNVSRVMGTWTKQGGYPVVIVERSGPKLILKQNRFLADKNNQYNESNSPYKYKWDIPIVYFTSDDVNKRSMKLFPRDSESVTIDLPSDKTWYKLNSKQVGYYRVNYPEDTWKQFTAMLMENPKQIPEAEDRANLLEDAFNLASSRYIDYSIPLEMVKYLKQNKEDSFLPWAVATNHLETIRKMLMNSDIETKFMEYVRNIVKPLVTEETWNVNDIPMDKMMLNVRILKLACIMELPSAIEKARQLLKDYLNDPSKRPHEEIRSIVYRYGMSGSDEEQKWNQTWEKYKEETSPHEYTKLRTALVSATKSQLLDRFLEYAKNEEYVRGQDYVNTLIDMAQLPAGNEATWRFLWKQWPYLVQRLTLNDRYLGKMLPPVIGHFASKEQLQTVDDFYKKYPREGAGKAGRLSARGRIVDNIKWVGNHKENLKSWLNTNI